MGFRPAALSILPLLLATSALAQEQQGGGDPVFNLPKSTQPPADPTRQGPELDVFRGAPVTPPPPVVVPPLPAPTVTPPPQATPQAQPQPPAPSRTPRPAAPTPRAEPAAPAAPQSSPSAPPLATPPQAQPQTAPQSAPLAPPPATSPQPAPLSPPSETTPWPWIAAGLLVIVAMLGAAWLLRRRRSEVEQPWDEPAVEEEPAPAPAAPRPRATPVPPPPQPKPAPAPATPPPAPNADRSWIDMSMEVRGARLSLMGATINYVLTLHNRGTLPAEDLLIRSLIANADANQQAMLQQFFAGSAGLPTHSIVAIAPGERQSLTGELRLLPDQIAPVQMGNRALLIPLVAFDAQYRWNEDDKPVGAGRTGRAFIIGEEKTPPADRLAPFRLDQGPRQYRAPGSRATALELAS